MLSAFRHATPVLRNLFDFSFFNCLELPIKSFPESGVFDAAVATSKIVRLRCSGFPAARRGNGVSTHE